MGSLERPYFSKKHPSIAGTNGSEGMMEMSEAENFLAGFCDVVNPIKKPSAVYAHPAEKLQDTLVFNLSIRDGLDRKPGCKTDGLVMGNPVAKLIDMVQLIENVLVVNAEYRSGFGLGWKNGQQFLAGCSILRTGIHIFPYAELHLAFPAFWDYRRYRLEDNCREASHCPNAVPASDLSGCVAPLQSSR